MAEYPICINGKKAGRLWVQRQGLYTVFTAKACGTEPIFLLVYGGGKRALLGRMLLRGGELFFSRRLTKNDMRGFPPVIEYAGELRPEEKDAPPAPSQPPPPAEKDRSGDHVWYSLQGGVLFCPEEKLIALPARLRDKTSVFSHIRVINGREYLVFRR